MTRKQLGQRGGLAVAIFGVAFAMAAPQGEPAQTHVIRYADNAGTMSIEGVGGINIKKLSTGEIRFITKAAANNKITANWIKDRMKIVAGGLTGVINIDSAKAYHLKSATMTDNLVVDFARASANLESKAEQTVHIQASEAEFSGDANTVTVKGGVSLLRKDPGVDQMMTASGSSGIITMSGLTAKANAVTAATLNGPVDMKLSGSRLGENGKPNKFEVTGHANKMVYNDANRTIVFTGNVTIDGNDPLIGGQITGVNSATITLTASGEIDEIDMSGSPGRTVVQEKKKSGGKRR